MSNPNIVSLQLGAAVTNGVCLSQTPGAAGALTINGSLATAGVATLSPAQRVQVSSTGSDAAVVFTITGTDRNGNKQSSPVTGVVSAAPVYTALDFATVTSVTSSAGTAGAITVGTTGVGSTEWQIFNWMDIGWFMAVACSGPAGTTYSYEHTYDDPTQTQTNLPQGFSLEPGSNVPPVPWPNPTINAVSGANEARYADWPIFAGRLTILSGTGKVTAQTLQAGRGSGHA